MVSKFVQILRRVRPKMAEVVVYDQPQLSADMVASTANSKETDGKAWTVVELTGSPLPNDLEFNPGIEADVFRECGLPIGMCLGSKSGYRRSHRRHFFIPNANVFCRRYGKVWWGDLDLWRHSRRLEQAAWRLRTRLYLLREFDGRFENTTSPFDEVRSVALWHTGGHVCPDSKLIQRSGLRISELATLASISRQRLVARQHPVMAQQINRRILTFERSFSPFTRRSGFEKWGEWFLAANQKLDGQTPLEAFVAGKVIKPTELFAELIEGTSQLAECYNALVAAIGLMAPPLGLSWPCTERVDLC